MKHERRVLGSLEQHTHRVSKTIRSFLIDLFLLKYYLKFFSITKMELNCNTNTAVDSHKKRSAVQWHMLVHASTCLSWSAYGLDRVKIVYSKLSAVLWNAVLSLVFGNRFLKQFSLKPKMSEFKTQNLSFQGCFFIYYYLSVCVCMEQGQYTVHFKYIKYKQIFQASAFFWDFSQRKQIITHPYWFKTSVTFQTKFTI